MIDRPCKVCVVGTGHIGLPLAALLAEVGFEVTGYDTNDDFVTRAARRFGLAFCPERTIEGKAIPEMRSLPQIVGGLDDESADRAEALFRLITPKIVRVSSLETAEMIKLINNTYRDLTFAFANEVALIAERMGLSAAEMIRAANVDYPRSNIAQPGFVGGPCLEKDAL